MLATLAPRAHRRDVVEAIVALELLFDYLDGLTERPSDDPLGEGERLFAALDGRRRRGREPLAAIALELTTPARSMTTAAAISIRCPSTVGGALARLPAALAITEVAQRIAALGGQAQTRMHAAATARDRRRSRNGLGVRRRARVCGGVSCLPGAASSVLVLHALIAAAADPAHDARADRQDRVGLPVHLRAAHAARRPRRPRRGHAAGGEPSCESGPARLSQLLRGTEELSQTSSTPPSERPLRRARCPTARITQ